MVKNEIAIKAKGVETSFLIQKQGVGSIKNLFLSLGRTKFFERKKILRGIDLHVYKGECVGLIGGNGSGKSTLLRAIAGVIPLDKGTIDVYGRIGPMLALGAGLEGEMSGLENIYLCCTLMGMTRKDIKASVQNIIDFSELGENIHTEVKRYSSGMMARLAFSIVVATNPDILIVDEALAVGDQGFKNKCLAKIDEFRSNGTTILFVSHEFAEVERICDKVYWIKEGLVHMAGTVDDVGEKYLEQFK
jgi:ABC-type polysaccharide/polyol phosphate transport system ATPase subunit